MPTRNELAVEYVGAQDRFQKSLAELRLQTEATVRAKIVAQDHPTDQTIDAHKEAQRVLRELHERAESLRTARDAVWRELKR